MEDNKIIELYEKRDELAISETNNKYGRYMNTIAFNVLRNKEDSEECVSESCLKTWNAIPPAKPNSFKAFIGRITRNTALDCLEKQTAEKRGGGEVALALDELAESISSFSMDVDPNGELEAKELSELINEMLESLSTEARRIFVLRYYYLYSVSEIAERLEVKAGKVSTSLSRSRSILAGLLKKEGYQI